MTHLHRWMLAAGSALALLAAACQTVPLTGRQQIILISPGEELSLGAAAYKKTLTESKISQDQAATDMVRRVCQRIAVAANRPDYRWEFTLIEDKTPNAFALPGGKVAVYTGILPLTKDETGLAVVMGHEVAHAIARHGAERMSTGLLTEIAGETAGIVFGGGNPQVKKRVQQAFALLPGVGVLLTFSR